MLRDFIRSHAAALFAIGILASSALVLLLPGEISIQGRIAVLAFPFAGLVIGFGLLWVVRRPSMEDRVLPILYGAIAVMTVALLATTDPAVAIPLLATPLGGLAIGFGILWLARRDRSPEL